MAEKSTRNLAYTGNTGDSENANRDNWITPDSILSRVRLAFGTPQISLDPFSSDSANQRVKALDHFTPQRDAFDQEWRALNVFMNPPYSHPLFKQAALRYIAMFAGGRFIEGITLTNNVTETHGGQRLLRYARAACFPDRRIQFVDDDGKEVSGNTRGQMVCYHGPRPEQFVKAFEDLGVCLGPYLFT